MHFLNYLRNDRRYPEIRLSQCFYWFLQVPEAGVETSASAQGNTTISESGGTSGGTLPEDPRLQAVVDAWPTLIERDRQTILKIITATYGQPLGG